MTVEKNNELIISYLNKKIDSHKDIDSECTPNWIHRAQVEINLCNELIGVINAMSLLQDSGFGIHN